MLVPRQYNFSYDCALNEYRMSHASAIPEDVVTGNGLTIQYPSVTQTTIAQGRDFYVIGKITGTLAANATMEVTVSDFATGKVVRRVHTAIKNNEAGMNVDYDGISITGDKEQFRKSCMPDLVYDPSNPSSFYDTWNKCYFTDSVYTCLIYGGKYTKDVNTKDEEGNELTVLPLGDYIITVSIGGYSVSQVITIGDIQNKILARFHPMNHRKNMIAEAERMNYTMFLDPFPGYWDTMMFNPEWGVNYVADNPRRWKYNDALEYVGGKVHLYIYDTKASSTSFSVELGLMQYNKTIEDPDRLEVHYYHCGDPVTPDGKTTGIFWKFDDTTGDKKGPIVLTRVDYLNEYIGNNLEYEKEDTLVHGISMDLEHLPLSSQIVSGVCRFRMLGVLRPLQTNQIVFNEDHSNYTYTNGAQRIEYILEDENGNVILSEDRNDYYVSLGRVIGGTREDSVLEFSHVFTLLEETVRKARRIRVKYRLMRDDGTYMPASGYIHLATFYRDR